MGSPPSLGHVFPQDDLHDHDIDALGKCMCEPILFPVQQPDGGIGTLWRHQAYDGREADEASE